MQKVKQNIKITMIKNIIEKNTNLIIVIRGAVEIAEYGGYML